MTPRRNDQVFQLSLTELAFTIAFILLLLLGYRVWQEETARAQAMSALEQAQAAERTRRSLERVRSEFAQVLRDAGVADADAAISRLVDADALRSERDRLRQQVDDLDARLSALAPVRPASAAPAGSAAREALGLASAARPSQEAAAEAGSRAAREVADLRGQVAFLSNRLGATAGHGGRDYPPCWADADGRVEFLFSIETRPGSVVVATAWPARRDAEALAMPGVAALLASPLSDAEFVRAVQGVYDWSRAQLPECRHYVALRSTIADAVQSDRARLMVERYFYKTEVPR